MQRTGLLTFALILAPMAAMAGGPAVPTMEPAIIPPAAPVVYAPSVDWTGFYAGGSLGYGKFTGGNDGQSALAGIDLGYRRDFGKAVVGAELSYDKNNIGENSANDQINSTTGIKLLAGYDMGRTLVYASIGAAQAEAQIGGVTATDNGYSAGIGVDYALSDKWTVGGEIQSHRYDDFNNSGVNLKDTSLEMKVGFRF
ncbi:MAG: porin family protein [bacterium]